MAWCLIKHRENFTLLYKGNIRIKISVPQSSDAELRCSRHEGNHLSFPVTQRNYVVKNIHSHASVFRSMLRSYLDLRMMT
jgi:hypothetical protein